MTVYSASPKVQVLVGDSNIDFSEAYVSFRTSEPEIDNSGLLRVTGTLVLGALDTPPASMNPYSATGRLLWAVGQRIIINVWHGSAWQRHPRGWVYIAEDVLPYGSNGLLTIQTYCKLELRTYPQPRGEGLRFAPTYPPSPTVSVRPTNSFSRTDAIAQALEKASVTPFVGEVGKYPIFASIPKEDANGYVDLAGQIAYGGLHGLYQNNQGEIDAFPLNLFAAPPLLTLELGKDDIDFEHTRNDNALEKVTHTGENHVTVQVVVQNIGNTQTFYGDGAIVDPALLGVQIAIREVTRTETMSPPVKTHREIVRAPLGSVAPQAFPKQTTLGLDSDTTEQWFYNGTQKALSLYRKTEQGLFSKLCASAWSKLSQADKDTTKSLIVEIVEETYYEYTGECVIKLITRRVIEPLGAIVGDEKHDDAFLPTVSLYQQQGWVQLRPQEWMFQQYTLTSATRYRSDLNFKGMSKSERISVKAALVTDGGNTFTQISNSGQVNPPAAERLSIEEEDQTVTITGSATFSVGSSPFEPKEETYSLDVGAVGSNQMTELSQLRGAWSRGRAQGARIVFGWNDVFLANPQPLQTIAVILPEVDGVLGKRKNYHLYQMDGLEFEFGEQAQIAALLIQIGVIEGEWAATGQTPIAPTFSAAAVRPPYTSLRLDSNGTGDEGELIVQPASYMISASYGGIGWGATTNYIDLLPFVLQSTGGIGWGATTNYVDIPGGSGGSGTYSTTIVSPLGNSGMSQISGTQTDDDYINVGDIGFDFPLYATNYRTNIFVGSNSYVTFGFGSDAYSSLGASNPGRGVLIFASDREWLKIFVQAGTNTFRIRFEGRTSPGGIVDFNWETTLFSDGVIMVVTDVSGVFSTPFMLTSGSSANFTSTTPSANGSWVYRPDGSGGYTVDPGSYTI